MPDLALEAGGQLQECVQFSQKLKIMISLRDGVRNAIQLQELVRSEIKFELQASIQ